MKHTHYQADIDSFDQDKLAALLCAGYNGPRAEKIRAALALALEAQKDNQVRPRGVDVAVILKKLRVDSSTLQATLLSDPYLREKLEERYLNDRFGKTVASLVHKVNWLNTFKDCTQEEVQAPEQAELLRQMLLAVVNDVRAVLIKLAYRVQRLRILSRQEYSVRRRIARETMDIFAPLANRLGVGQLKWEMEDLAFRYLDPQAYRKTAKALAESRTVREAYIRNFISRLNTALKQEAIHAKIYGRPKHIYSIWRKMQHKQVDLEELYDILAVRLIVDKVPSCYAVLGLIHSQWLHVPKEFDDYIANPKENGYQSLHTVVIGPEGQPVEIQIRTKEMHDFAEFGVAAHWRYKEGGKRDLAFERSIASLRRLLESREDDDSLLEDFRSELFSDSIFVLTPKGQVIRLVNGATPLDFAYAIHTEVGHRCRGAKVNGRIVPLTCQLKSGEQVEILTTKQGAPSRNWLDANLGYIKTSRARGKIKQWFRQQDHEKNIRTGKIILERERQKFGLKGVDLDELTRHFHLSRQEDLLIGIGRGDIGPNQLAGALKIPDLTQKTAIAAAPKKIAKQPENEAVTIQGVGNLLTHFAQCCLPAPGDSIIGYITKGKGVTVHRRDCSNIIQLSHNKQKRLVDVSWGEQAEAYAVDIHIQAFDRKNLLRDITQVLSNAQINILSSFTQTNPDDRLVNMAMKIEVSSTAELSLIMDKISQLHNILKVKRNA